ncbi:protein-L-isoaspartate(D-aspartate) O-methyltransferase [Micromonospora purpureochromogenes]|uniref:Protein-L-isoaspartate O-methyltransferase n=1 Tax=Micromonospora purpureochromogenes TaxID=47872 RepID=A0A1C4Z7F5_9ACTN|nr:methyltransferase, FxLD system [Micromonospora purpureochromogenes]SCF28898.1 protein-L-isoaspartate(D-aspartate) O-methyltransferase [Micromonospora purpureochromogenes]
MPTPAWRQYTVEFPTPSAAEDIAASALAPALTAAQNDGVLHGWWYVRKYPTWRWRYVADDPTSHLVEDLLETLAIEDGIINWTRGVYEPEMLAFGGTAGMHVAHELFHQDSHHLLLRPAAAPTVLGRRESAVLLCSVLMRSAGLDWYEQGDVWAKVTELRPSPAIPAEDQAASLTRSINRLMTVDARSLSQPDSGGPLMGYGAWLDAFENAGQALADLARQGRLRRGLRSVLAHHVIFHANRMGLSVRDQSTLAALAVRNVFHTTTRSTMSTSAPTPPTTSVDRVTTLREPTDLRTELTDRLRAENVIRTPAVEAAMRRTPRHLFLPGVPLQQAYVDGPVYTKTDGSGTSISAASQPRIVAMMLEQLDAQPGHRVLEAGAGTGYNAALLAAIVGDSGRVVTIDVDDDLVAGAREHLAAAGVANVEVVHGDGALGHPDGAPYDRIIATVGAWETPTAWLEQLAPDGRLVVPLRLRGAASRSIIFERHAGGWRDNGSELAVFMPLRGIGDDARRLVALSPEQDVTLQVHKDQEVDAAALAGVLDTERQEMWTDVLFPPMVPYEWMDLWLACRLDNAIMRMNVRPASIERGTVTPMFPWGAMATTRGADLAYLTIRPAPPAADGRKMYEVGVIGHGPGGKDLAQHVSEEIRTWDADYRSRTVRFDISDAPVEADPSAGRFVLPSSHHPITVTWE